MSSGHQRGPCSLCNQTSTRYFHTESWESRKYTHFVDHVLPPTMSTNDQMCICCACHYDINSNTGNENHTPRWKKLKISKVAEFTPCPIQGCTSHADVTTTASRLDNIPDDITVTGQAASKFCSFHYHYIYNYQHQTVCKTCGKRARAEESFRYCPNPQLIEKYLRGTTGINLIITDRDKFSCYTK